MQTPTKRGRKHAQIDWPEQLKGLYVIPENGGLAVGAAGLSLLSYGPFEGWFSASKIIVLALIGFLLELRILVTEFRKHGTTFVGIALPPRRQRSTIQYAEAVRWVSLIHPISKYGKRLESNIGRTCI